MTTENRTKRPNKAGRTILIVIFLLALVAGAYFLSVTGSSKMRWLPSMT